VEVTVSTRQGGGNREKGIGGGEILMDTGRVDWFAGKFLLSRYSGDAVPQFFYLRNCQKEVYYYLVDFSSFGSSGR
jgi:hypothetical protein